MKPQTFFLNEQHTMNTDTVYKWLVSLELAVPPFVETGPHPHLATVQHVIPMWVNAIALFVYRAASHNQLEVNAQKDRWRKFLGMLAHLPMTCAAIDSIARIGPEDAAVDYVGTVLFDVEQRIAMAPFVNRVVKVAKERETRIAYAADRLPDEEYTKPANLPKLKARGR